MDKIKIFNNIVKNPNNLKNYKDLAECFRDKPDIVSALEYLIKVRNDNNNTEQGK